MSDWNRGGREDDQRRYGSEDRDRREFGGRDRWRDQGQSGGERRSFGQGGQDEEHRNFRDWEDPQRAYGTSGAGSRGYGQQEFRGQESRSRFGDQDYGSMSSQRGYGERNDDSRRFGGREDGRQGYGQQGYGQQGGGAFDARNDMVRRVSDGESDRGMRSFGEHRGRGPKNYSRSDDRIREDVNDRLSDDSWLDASEIEVQVVSGEVTLIGIVHSREDKRRAEDLAEQVSGAKHVQNNLRVQQGAGSQNMGQQNTAQGATANTGQQRGAGQQGSGGASQTRGSGANLS